LHTFKIIHRDLKPENIMIFKQDKLIKIKLIDLGIAKKLSNDN